MMFEKTNISPACTLLVLQSLTIDKDGSRMLITASSEGGTLVTPLTRKAAPAVFVVDTPSWLSRRFETTTGKSTTNMLSVVIGVGNVKPVTLEYVQ